MTVKMICCTTAKKKGTLFLAPHQNPTARVKNLNFNSCKTNRPVDHFMKFISDDTISFLHFQKTLQILDSRNTHLVGMLVVQLCDYEINMIIIGTVSRCNHLIELWEHLCRTASCAGCPGSDHVLWVHTNTFSNEPE
jgi:hypothetical protein